MDEEEEMIKRVMEMSEREERERLQKLKDEEDRANADEIRSLKNQIHA